MAYRWEFDKLVLEIYNLQNRALNRATYHRACTEPRQKRLWLGIFWRQGASCQGLSVSPRSRKHPHD